MIKRIEATNFRIFKSRDERCARLNLLTGVNGSGKSSLLQLLLLSQRMKGVCDNIFGSPSYDDLRYRFASPNEKVSFDVEFDNAPAPLNYTIVSDGNSYRIECSDDRCYCRNVSFISTFRGEPALIHSNENLVDDIRPYGHGEGVDEIAYLNAFGGFGEEKFGRLNDKTNTANTMRRGGNRLIDWVNYWLDRISPGVSVSTESTMEGNGTVVHIEYNGRKFIPETSSNGIYSILHVVLAVLTASCEDIVLIQNPEAYLHPHAQSIVVEFLARAAASGVQLFVETLSDLIINSFRVSVKNGIISAEDVTIMEFSRKEIYNEAGGGDNEVNEHEENINRRPSEIYADVKNVKINSNGELVETPQGFMTEWSNQLMALGKGNQ